MKTEGLTFLEAVQALEDGKCEKIQVENGSRYYKNKAGDITLFGVSGGGICLPPRHLLGNWKLIGVKQKVVFEGVEWSNKDANGFTYPLSHSDVPNWPMLINKPKMKMTLEWEE